MQKYFLMHGDVVCGDIVFGEEGRILSYKDKGTGYSPFLGNTDEAKIKQWWKTRTVPANRSIIQDLIKGPEGINAEQYLEKNLAFSMTDSYWLRPYGMDLTYEQVKFSNLSGYNDGRIPYHNATSYDLNASLGGQMEKYWDLTSNIPELVKESNKYYGQQALNELFATKLHEMIGLDVNFVRYSASKIEGGGILCRCKSFTSGTAELVPAYEVIDSRKCPNDRSIYDHYINICKEHGIAEEEMQKFLDYQTITDFIISNTDEHLYNFGILRDPITLDFLSPAPIFDSGNSMFYSDNVGLRYTRAGLLERKITAVKKNEEGMLGLIKNRALVPLELLPNVGYVKEFYTKAGLPEEKADGIACNYGLKLEMYREFQLGKKISLYNEKLKERDEKRKGVIKKNVQFHMLCGLPRSGKTKKAGEIIDNLVADGYKKTDSKPLYSIERCADENNFLLDEGRTLTSVRKIDGYDGMCVLISANDIRNEMQNECGYVNDEIVFLTAKARVKAAVISGASVVFDATNADRQIRMSYLNMVKSSAKVYTELHVQPFLKERPDEVPEYVFQGMSARIKSGYPYDTEGWDKVNTPELIKSHEEPGKRGLVQNTDGDDWEDRL